MVMEAAAPHAVMSVSTVTSVVFPAAADTASPSASRSAARRVYWAQALTQSSRTTGTATPGSPAKSPA